MIIFYLLLLFHHCGIGMPLDGYTKTILGLMRLIHKKALRSPGFCLTSVAHYVETTASRKLDMPDMGENLWMDYPEVGEVFRK